MLAIILKSVRIKGSHHHPCNHGNKSLTNTWAGKVSLFEYLDSLSQPFNPLDHHLTTHSEEKCTKGKFSSQPTWRPWWHNWRADTGRWPCWSGWDEADHCHVPTAPVWRRQTRPARWPWGRRRIHSSPHAPQSGSPFRGHAPQNPVVQSTHPV